MSHEECSHTTPLPPMTGKLEIITLNTAPMTFTANEAGWVIRPAEYILINPHDEYCNPLGTRSIIPFSQIVLIKETMNDAMSTQTYEAWYAKEHGVSIDEAAEMRAKSIMTQALMDLGVDPDSIPGFGSL